MVFYFLRVMTMAKLGDFLTAINLSKKNLMEDDPLAEKEYPPFVINRTLSYFQDTVLYANEMNLRSQLDNRLQNDYFLNSVRKKRRYSKWLKPEKLSDMDIVKEYYGFGNQKAKDALSILTKEQLDYIKDKLNQGGVEK